MPIMLITLKHELKAVEKKNGGEIRKIGDEEKRQEETYLFK